MLFKKLIFSIKKVNQTAFLIALVLISFEAKSSHMAGAELVYQFEGNDRYNVIYTLYTDCSGSQPPTSVNLMVRSQSCGLNNMFALSLIPGSEIVISTNCSSSLSTCNGGTAAGYKQLKYSASILLSEKCNDIIFSVTDCCRNSAITSIVNPESQPLYVEAQLDNISSPNNSPIFDSKPILILSSNQSNLLSESAIDSDGDSLVYSLIAPKTSEITQVTYANGFSANQFISSVSTIDFNAENGSIKLTPSSIETAIFAVKVIEFRNGIAIGSAMRDIQVISSNSNNHIPTIQQLDVLPTLIYKTCVGNELTINLSSVDIDAGQQVLIDATSNISDLEITKSSDRLQSAQIKWTPKTTDLQNRNHWIKINVSDDACPMNGMKTYYLEIKVSELLVSASVTNSDCDGKNNGSILTSISGNQFVEYTWSNTSSGQSYARDLSAGEYTVSIDNLNGCIVNRVFQVNNTDKILVEETTTPSYCGLANGKVEISVSGGNNPYQFNWNDGSNVANRDDLPKGVYTVTVTDQIGCKALKQIIIKNSECSQIESQFKLYPNPATDKISLENDFLSSSIVSILISDATGKIVYNNENEIKDKLMTTIDISGLSTGIYIVKITSLENSITLPFIRQ